MQTMCNIVHVIRMVMGNPVLCSNRNKVPHIIWQHITRRLWYENMTDALCFKIQQFCNMTFTFSCTQWQISYSKEYVMRFPVYINVLTNSIFISHL